MTIEPDNAFGGNLLEQIFDLWVEPELERRGASLRRHEVERVLVILAPGRRVRVHINDEARFVAHARVSRPVAEGEAVTLADIDEIESLRPDGIDPDAGWVGFVLLGGTYRIAFDFRRNRDRASRLLERAEEFVSTACDALEGNRLGPCIENAFAAAELAVLAQMYLIEDKPTRDHAERRRWWRDWTGLGNAPNEQGEALAQLGKLRRAARYAEKKLDASREEVTRLVDLVGDMIAHARGASGW